MSEMRMEAKNQGSMNLTPISPAKTEYLSGKEKKEKLLEMAKAGAKKPRINTSNIEERKLGTTLSRSCSEKSRDFDQDFKNKITAIRPDWFTKTSDLKKEELLKIAKERGQRPSKHSESEHERALANALHEYLKKTSFSYDEEFASEIKKVAPHWLRTHSKKKKQLTQWASVGKDRPRDTEDASPQERSLSKTLDNYESVANTIDQLKRLRPDWFNDKK